jgi:hypothetical protein
MNAVEVSQRTIDAWNRHDVDAMLAAYAKGRVLYYLVRSRAVNGCGDRRFC